MTNFFYRKLSFKSDLLITLINGFAVIGGIFILNGIIARMYGLEILGEFLLIKRILTAVVGILLIGMNIGLPNYLSRKFEKSYGDNAFLIFIIITIPLTLLFINILMRYNISGFYPNQYWVYVIFSLGLTSQFITYALFRGYMYMISANILQFLGTAIIPIMVFLLAPNLHISLMIIGLIIFIIMTFSYLICNKGINWSAINKKKSKAIIKYGLTRVISFISQFILLAGIPIFIASTVDLHSVAYFNSSLSLVRLSLLFVNPIGMILLPRISNKLANDKIQDVSQYLELLLKTGFIVSILGTVYIFINAQHILSLWLGEVSTRGANILRVVILGLPFFTISGLARSPIDAGFEKGKNSLVYGIAAISLIVTLILGLNIGFNPLNIALASFIISQIFAFIGSLYFLSNLFNYKLLDVYIIRDITIGILVILSVDLLISYIKLSHIFQLLSNSCIYLIMGLLFYKNVKSGWLADIKSHFGIN